MFPVPFNVNFENCPCGQGYRADGNEYSMDPVPCLPVQILRPDVVVGEEEDGFRH